ncbi:glycosyltransferase [Neobacillus kokaensis]|uniref:Glycosyl transferase family 1 domain-containing protein n=1 Tax=Neobacillus kokaensis TaxID=2759023 RepID=A0ABQ3N3K6_9BACI|nr:glycosyltransferase [Neobacillus kokaensis]GHH98661.1 hypothetical protein AM1BK_22040 [Neobacillus kokaensis]
MKVLYIGYAIDKDLCNKQLGASVAGNNMQIGVIEELYKLLDGNLDIITIFPTAPYPKVNNFWIRKRKINISPNIKAQTINFVNLPIIKQLWQIVTVFLSARIYVKNNQGCKILTFNAFPAIGVPILLISKLYNCETISILADLPIDTIKRNPINRLFRLFMDKVTIISIKAFDKIIALNRNAIKEFAPNKPNIIIDGGFPLESINLNKFERLYESTGEKILLFAGTLVDYNGIKMLIEAMRYVSDKNVVLHIYGTGPLLNFVKQKADINSNIRYMGNITNSEMLLLQKQVYFLVNPRPVNDPISLVTFPSKILEYMLSGTPILSTKLNGFTEDYLKFINIINDTDSAAMGQSINNALKISYDKLMKRAESGLEFVLENKSWETQCQKIYNFLKQTHQNNN